MATGINVSKANVYSVIGPDSGISVTKALVHTALEQGYGINISKAIIHVVICEPTAPSGNPHYAYAQQ